MKKIIKIVSYLCLGVCLVSCSNEEDLKVSSQKQECVNQQSFTTNDISGVMDKLNELNLTYGINPAHRMLRRSHAIPNSIDDLPNLSGWTISELGSSRGWQIADKDGQGAVEGAIAGGAIGTFGGGLGISIGAVVGGAVYGTIKSIAFAKADTSHNCMAVIESPMQYNSLPGSINNTYVPENPIPCGMEIGRYHNALCAYIMETNSLGDACSMDDIYDVVVENVVDGLGSYFSASDLVTMQSIFTENKTEMLNLMEVNIDTYLDSIGMTTEHEILKHYTYSVVSAETYFDLYSYTMGYINIINSAQQSGILTEESALCINAYISTFESSKELWNLNFINPITCNMVILYTSSGDWKILNRTEAEILATSLGGQFAFVGFPLFSNGNLTRVYIKDDFQFNSGEAIYNVTTLFNNEYFETDGDPLYINNEIVNYVREGVFAIHNVEGYEGSYRYIDFTDKLN